MKKLVFFLLLLASGWMTINGQLHNPVQPYNESGYTVKDFEQFALNTRTVISQNLNGYLSASYRKELLIRVNKFLIKTGLYKNYNNGAPLDEAWISWIFNPSRTWAEHRIYPNGFGNTYQSLDCKTVDPYWDMSYFNGMITTLHLEGYELDLAKTICMNLVDVPFKTILAIPKQVESAPLIVVEKEKQDNWTYVPPKKTYEKPVIDLNIYKPPVVKKGHKGAWVWYTIAGVALTSAVAGVYYLTKDHNHYYGGPGAAPTTIEGPSIPAHPPVITPPIITPPVEEPGGPGGAPTTTGKSKLNLGFSFKF